MFYVNFFFFFSILGYLEELVLGLVVHNGKETLLLGPWMPIYGIGMLLINLINYYLEKKGLNGKKKIFVCYLCAVVVLFFLEGLGGILTEYFFHKSFWDYTGYPLSVGRYCNIFVSLGWGLLAVILEYALLPKIRKFLEKTPKWVTIAVIIFFIIDHLYCFEKYNLLYNAFFRF